MDCDCFLVACFRLVCLFGCWLGCLLRLLRLFWVVDVVICCTGCLCQFFLVGSVCDWFRLFWMITLIVLLVSVLLCIFVFSLLVLWFYFVCFICIATAGFGLVLIVCLMMFALVFNLLSSRLWFGYIFDLRLLVCVVYCLVVWGSFGFTLWFSVWLLCLFQVYFVWFVIVLFYFLVMDV